MPELFDDIDSLKQIAEQKEPLSQWQSVRLKRAINELNELRDKARKKGAIIECAIGMTAIAYYIPIGMHGRLLSDLNTYLRDANGR